MRRLAQLVYGAEDAPPSAVTDLKGRAARTALLEISGQFNPTAKPLAMDIRARATDLELAPLLPYSGKYAGYVIGRGKLSMDLAHQITPEGQLQAKNKVGVNQLTFGDRVDSPDATSLPVRLAVSLLQKERARERARDGQVPAVVSGAASAPEVFSAAERERLLKAVYKQTDIPDRPRNLVGMAKDIPGPEMEALLRKVIPVTDDLMRELALQRGLAVRDGLVAQGLPSERLFVGAPKPRVAYEPFTDSVPGAELALKND